jgi:DNA-binding transcriptional MerR regulator
VCSKVFSVTAWTRRQRPEGACESPSWLLLWASVPTPIRFYERTGLLLAPARTPADYRVYEASAVDRLRFIQGTQRLGLKLRDIKELLAIRDTGVCPCEPAEELLRRRLADLDAEMARLSALREQMVAMVEALPSQHCPPPLTDRSCPAQNDRR